jgi:DNA modification methylase
VTRAQFPAVGEVSSSQDAWRNQLIWGDNLPVMDALLPDYAGAIDLMYIDPPFATGTNFFLASEEPAYEDTWGQGLSNYLSMLWPRLQRMHKLLRPTGSIYVHIGWEVSAHVQLLMNEIFGPACLQNVIVYNYGKFHHAKTRWKRDFDVLLFYSKDPRRWTFNHDAVLDAYGQRTEIRFDKCDENGKRYKIVKGRRVYRQEGVTPSSVWRLSNLQLNAVESVGYPTQKTEALLTKIIAASSNPGDVVADFFCGSGTTLAVAEKLGRRWIGCDLGQAAIQVTQKRLLTLPERRAFDLLELGTG